MELVPYIYVQSNETTKKDLKEIRWKGWDRFQNWPGTALQDRMIIKCTVSTTTGVGGQEASTIIEYFLKIYIDAE